MFRSVKKAMATAVVIAVGSLAASASASASFPVWDPAGAADGVGQLTWSLGAAHFTCDVDLTLDLVNDGTLDGGDITSFTASNCSSNDPRCTVVVVADMTPPWTVMKFTSNTSKVGIGGVVITFSLSGPTCPLNNVNLVFDGNIEGDYDGNTGELAFNGATGLTSALGNPTVTGSVVLTTESAGDPVGLV